MYTDELKTMRKVVENVLVSADSMVARTRITGLMPDDISDPHQMLIDELEDLIAMIRYNQYDGDSIKF